METTRIIESYLDCTMEVEERNKFEVRAKNDKELAELIKVYKEVNESIRDTDLYILRKKLNKIVSEQQILFLGHIFRFAATILFLLCLGIVFKILLFHSLPGPVLFDKYYERYEPDIIIRSPKIGAHDLSEALINYESRNYVRCNHLLDSIIIKEKSNYLAMFYKGVTCLELQSPLDAIKAFSNIPKCWNSPYAIHRDWYLALSMIKVQRENDAIGLFKKLMGNENFYTKKSNYIFIKIKKQISRK